MGLVSLEDYRGVLEEATAGEVRYVLVGGLAVALWAEQFSVMPDQLPLYSKDMDLRGLKPVAQTLGLLLQSRGLSVPLITTVNRKTPPGMGRTHVLQVELPTAGRTQIEVMERLPLLDDEASPPQGKIILLAGVQVLDPISLLICKAHAWNHRPKEDPTNDAVHIAMLAKIVPQFAAESHLRKLDLGAQWAALRKAVVSCPLPLEKTFWQSVPLP